MNRNYGKLYNTCSLTGVSSVAMASVALPSAATSSDPTCVPFCADVEQGLQTNVRFTANGGKVLFLCNAYKNKTFAPITVMNIQTIAGFATLCVINK